MAQARRRSTKSQESHSSAKRAHRLKAASHHKQPPLSTSPATANTNASDPLHRPQQTTAAKSGAGSNRYYLRNLQQPRRQNRGTKITPPAPHQSTLPESLTVDKASFKTTDSGIHSILTVLALCVQLWRLFLQKVAANVPCTVPLREIPPGHGAGPRRAAPTAASSSRNLAGSSTGRGINKQPSRKGRGRGKGSQPPGDRGPPDSNSSDGGENDANGQLYACPFFRRHNMMHLRCLHACLKRPGDLRQHLSRKHMQRRTDCSRCFRPFDTFRARDAHVCQPDPRVRQDLVITDAQMEEIVARTGGNQDRATKWFVIWDILFPSAPRPPRHHAFYSTSELADLIGAQFCRFFEAEMGLALANSLLWHPNLPPRIPYDLLRNAMHDNFVAFADSFVAFVERSPVVSIDDNAPQEPLPEAQLAPPDQPLPDEQPLPDQHPPAPPQAVDLAGLHNQSPFAVAGQPELSEAEMAALGDFMAGYFGNGDVFDPA